MKNLEVFPSECQFEGATIRIDEPLLWDEDFEHMNCDKHFEYLSEYIGASIY